MLDEREMKEIRERWEKARNFEEPDRVPIGVMDIEGDFFACVLGFDRSLLGIGGQMY